MKNKLTARRIIYDWIDTQLSFQKTIEFSSVEIQSDVVMYGRARGVWHIPDYYSREWRGIRQMQYIGFSLPYNVYEFFKEGSKVKWYRVTKNND